MRLCLAFNYLKTKALSTQHALSQDKYFQFSFKYTGIYV